MNQKDEVPKKNSKPHVVKLDYSSRLCEQWVKNMSKPSEDRSSNSLHYYKPRPPSLGIGAAVPRQTHVVPSNDPVERKLQGNLAAAKRKAAREAEESVPSARDETLDEDSEEELESRSKAISKKPTKNFTSLQKTKRQK